MRVEAGPWTAVTNELEAVRWISVHPETGNRSPLSFVVRFGTADEAIEFVKSLYSAGSPEVIIDPESRNPTWNGASSAVTRHGGANALLVRVPDPSTTAGAAVLELLRSERDQRSAWVVANHDSCPSMLPDESGDVVRIEWMTRIVI